MKKQPTLIQQKVACMIVAAALCLSCTSSDETNIDADVKAFACSYFNFRYSDALNFCTPESEKWIKFKASNISQADIDVVNNQTDTAECEVDGIDMNDDGTATAHVEIKNFLLNDSIGKAGVMCKSAKFSFTLFKHADHWKVHLSSLPQTER